MTDRYVVEVERDGVRTLYGTFANMNVAQKFAGRHEDANRVMVRELIHVSRGKIPISDPDRVVDHVDYFTYDSSKTDSSKIAIHPGQTTIEDHIDNMADYVDPNSVS